MARQLVAAMPVNCPFCQITGDQVRLQNVMKPMKSFGGLLVLGLTVGAVSASAATAPTPEEMAEAHRWIAAKVEAPAAGARREAGLGRAGQSRSRPQRTPAATAGR